MENEQNPEAQKEAISSELTRLAEAHGVTLAEIAQIASEMSSTQPTKQPAEAETRQDNLTYLYQQAGQRWGGFAVAIPVPIEDKEAWDKFNAERSSRMIETLESLGFQLGAQASVERTDGSVEHDWTISSYNSEGNTVKSVTLYKNTSEGQLVKNVDLLKFINLNFGFNFKG